MVGRPLPTTDKDGWLVRV